ncbi:unnamed protein product [Danaus chrysippus]|uniref:Kynureninase n=1 Tax=Danaus chrysippus TaxID=151541 RepID=A0A8J2QQ40_9NEOP|nr:unnamed protein product [Danaus chrysippus]
MSLKYKDGLEYSTIMDNKDILAHFRQRFYVKEDNIYMCGNSLGLASKDAEKCILNAIEKWKTHGVQMWNVDRHKYYEHSKRLGGLMAKLVGADSDEVTVTGSTTVNIHQAIATFYKPTKKRFKILVDDTNFPTDRYAVDSQVILKGFTPKDAVKIVKAKGRYVLEEDVISAMTEEVALVLLPAVYYNTAQLLDMRRISYAAKEKGILVGWDLSHAVGCTDIDLKCLDVDFAVWCTYKYLNGGPGSPAGLYINRKHFNLVPGLAGWWGNKIETQFLLRQQFEHRKDAGGWQIGTPHLLSMAGLEGSLKMFLEAGMSNIRKKSLEITGYLIFLVETKLSAFGFTIGSPREENRRGGHVCVEHEQAYRISLALKTRGVTSDFREPNILRFTPAALYISYEDVYKMVDILMDIAKNETYKKITPKRNMVL